MLSCRACGTLSGPFLPFAATRNSCTAVKVDNTNSIQLEAPTKSHNQATPPLRKIPFPALVARHAYSRHLQSTKSFNTLIALALRHTAVGVAKRLFEQMNQSGFLPDRLSWRLWVRLLVSQGKKAEALQCALKLGPVGESVEGVPLDIWLELIRDPIPRRASTNVIPRHFINSHDPRWINGDVNNTSTRDTQPPPWKNLPVEPVTGRPSPRHETQQTFIQERYLHFDPFFPRLARVPHPPNGDNFQTYLHPSIIPRLFIDKSSIIPFNVLKRVVRFLIRAQSPLAELAHALTNQYLEHLPHDLTPTQQFQAISLVNEFFHVRAAKWGEQGGSHSTLDPPSSAVHRKHRALLDRFLALHSQLQPNHETLLLLLGSLRKSVAGSKAIALLEEFETRWGSDVVDLNVRRVAGGMAMREGSLHRDFVGRMVNEIDRLLADGKERCEPTTDWRLGDMSEAHQGKERAKYFRFRAKAVRKGYASPWKE